MGDDLRVGSTWNNPGCGTCESDGGRRGRSESRGRRDGNHDPETDRGNHSMTTCLQSALL